MPVRLNQAQPYVLSLFRFVVGLLFAIHGAATLFGAFGGDQAETGAWPGWYAALIQLVCGSLVALGLGTRAAAFLASGSMAYAYFKVHQPEALLPIENGGEPSALFCWAFLLLVFTGPGAVALDRFFGSRNTTAATEHSPHRDQARAVSI
ncbi:DoxX family protein [Streptomyces sp. NPDC059698]|uniref:DoxX family protein n=1 Tax=unclassified Streptomyces TaxID=2593676 RepID=UPI000938AD98|nr:DoxX family protein [Streptomyces sp. CB02366]OKJ37082.1 DoxX family protein [Streptomyces sp. CB02366]TVP36189.1 DoxX family protein [Streptomyces griseus subsp. griseus]WSS55260.1 DoxX family protein [Streptomyces sp. NBC_01178]